MSGDYSWVTWVLVVLGWLYVDYTNNRRETRKEARAAVDAAKKDVQTIAKSSVTYFTDLTNSGTDEIKSSLELLEVELERLAGYHNSGAARRMEEFHEACTGADFESASRVAHDVTSDVVRNIKLARNRLIAQLERHFRASYH